MSDMTELKDRTIEELLAKSKIELAQNAKDQVSAKAETVRLKAEMAELVRRLEESKKLELRHGDYGLCTRQGVRCMFVCYQESDVLYLFLTPPRGDRYMGMFSSATDMVIMGNQDDLKAIAEPLANFSLDVHDYGYNPQFGSTPFKMAGNWHTREEVEAHVIKLNRLLLTAQKQDREAGK